MHITDCSSPHTERKLRPHTARPPLPAAIAIAIAIANAIAIAIATTGRAMPCRQLTGCILQGKKSKMSVFCRCMGLSHLAVGFRHYLQHGLALVGSASHSTVQTISQMVVIHAAFHGASQVVQQRNRRDTKCRQIDDHFDDHANAAVQCRAHRPMKHNQGFTRSQWIQPSGECSHRIAAAAAWSTISVKNTKH